MDKSSPGAEDEAVGPLGPRLRFFEEQAGAFCQEAQPLSHNPVWEPATKEEWKDPEISDAEDQRVCSVFRPKLKRDWLRSNHRRHG